MKNNLIKSTLVLLLCLIIFAGCGVVPTPEVTPAPTPTEPTPTPYGEVLDLNVFHYGTTLQNLPVTTQYYEILLERFSLKMKTVTSIEEADIVFNDVPTDSTKEWLFFLDSESIDLIDYIDEMPNLLALYETPNYHEAWMYEKSWFTKNGYAIPQTMDELLTTFVNYKTKKPDEKLIMAGLDKQSEDGYSLTELAIALTYGVDLQDKNAKNHPNYTKAVNAIKIVRENDLIEYDNTDYVHNYSKYAVYYTLTGGLIDTREGIKDIWKAFDTQLSDNENEVFVSESGNIYKSPIGDYFTKFYLRENNNPLVLDRLLDYLDWCCSDEGIILSYFGDDYEIRSDGVINERTYGKYGVALRVVNAGFAETYVFPKYVSGSDVEGIVYGRVRYKIFKALENKALTVIQIEDLPKKIDPKDKLSFYGQEIYDMYIKNK